MEGNSEAKSICCANLPSKFLDKQEAKKFFSQFGVLRRFILYPSKMECVIEFETVESAQKALNAKVDFNISPARQSPKNEYFIDPDVQAELDSMLPVGAKSSAGKMQQIPTIESFIKNPPQSFIKTSKDFSSIKARTEPLTVQTPHTADPRQVQIARNELEALCKKPARSEEERFYILDARDKLYRVINARPADIKRAESIKGTCNDMCPEKERWMRIARLQVSSFELDDDGQFMDASRAIKQYSRSSADQEIPLPHELRSDTVLKTTMTYLLHNVMNLCEDEGTPIGDWFHFIWDRTRGIRKDITQQELCTPTSVELLEQCARFHIHCSARLIAEDPSVFDRKINDENLTKSLQTLKYMYDDLKKKNIKCPNEAEFRGYVVLLNLNESGNFLWEIKGLEKDILNSQEVRFALKVYFAVSLNNYVKFFNLLKDATYMNACIMLKYFTQIRLKALFTIIRSWRRGQGLNFSISYLTEILAFEDDDATAHFLTYYGAFCDKDADIVNLDPQTFGSAETPFQMDRSLEIVESKMEGTVAEAICGAELPDPDCFRKIVPHSSFDERGFLKKEAFYAEDQNGPIKDGGVFKVPMESPPVSPGRSMFQQKQKNDQTDSVFSAKSTSFANPFAQSKFSCNVFGASPKASVIAEMPSDNIFGSPSFSTVKKVEPPMIQDNPFMAIKASPIFSNAAPASSIFGSSVFGSVPGPKTNFSYTSQQQNQALLLEQENRRKMEEEEQQRKRQEEQEEERKQIELENRRRIAEEERIRRENDLREEQKRQELIKRLREKNEKRQELERLRIKKLENDAEKIFNSLSEEIIEEHLRSEGSISIKLYDEIPREFYDALEYDTVVEELYKIFNQELTCRINAMQNDYRMLSKFFRAWHSTTKQQIEKRKKLSSIGCSMINQSLEEIANDLKHPEQKAALANMKVYLSGKPQQISLPNLENYKKIDFFRELKVKMTLPLRKFFWKMLISVPMRSQEKCTGFASFIKTFLNKTFDVQESEDVFYLKSQLMQRSAVLASICMRKVQGLTLLNENDKPNDNELIANANSLLFFCTISDLPSSRQRLQNILKNLTHSIAVSIIVYKNLIEPTDENLIAQHLNLTSENNVSDFEINIFYECHEKSKDLTEIVLESCQFLCDSHLNQLQTRNATIFDLEMQQMSDFLQFCLGDEMWQRIEVSCRDSKEFNSSLKSFNNVIHLYNSCIDKLIKIHEKDFSSLPSLSIEFRNKLPPLEVKIPNSFEYFPEDWKSKEKLKNFVALLNEMKINKMNEDHFSDFNDFKAKLSEFLHTHTPTNHDQIYNAVIEKVINGFYRLQLQTNQFSSEFVSQLMQRLRWLDIIGIIVVGRFNEVSAKHKNLPSFIIYDKKELRKYLIPWWYMIKFTRSSHDEDPTEPQKKKVKTIQKFDPAEFKAIMQKGIESSKKMTEIIKKSKQNLTKTSRTEPNLFDQYLYQCEGQFKSLKHSLDAILVNDNDN